MVRLWNIGPDARGLMDAVMVSDKVRNASKGPDLQRITRACSVAQLCPTLPPYGLQSTRLFCSWDYPSKNDGVVCHFLHPTQGLNLHLLQLLYWQADSLPLSHLGSPQRTVKMVNYIWHPWMGRWKINEKPVRVLINTHNQKILRIDEVIPYKD